MTELNDLGEDEGKSKKKKTPQNYPDYCYEEVHIAYFYGIHQHALFKSYSHSEESAGNTLQS